MNELAGSELPVISDRASAEERVARDRFFDLFKRSPIPDNELMMNLALYINRQALSRLLFVHEIYRQIVDVHGIVIEFGCRWGRNLALFESFRGMYEPFNFTRRIVGFDTFSGFPQISREDGKDDIVARGHYSVTEGYEAYLGEVLDYHERESPIAHIRKYEVVKGDASNQIRSYLERHQETIVALAYFDMDLYEPTRNCLLAIKDRLTRGSILAFDELNHERFPGETLAAQEVLGLDRYSIRRLPYNATASYLVIE